MLAFVQITRVTFPYFVLLLRFLPWGFSQTYADPPAITPVQNRPKDDKAFDNTAFVDYEEPLSIKTEYYQLNDVLEPSESGKVYKLRRKRINEKRETEFCRNKVFHCTPECIGDARARAHTLDDSSQV